MRTNILIRLTGLLHSATCSTSRKLCGRFFGIPIVKTLTDNVYFPISSSRTAKVNFSKSIKNLRCIIHQFSSCQYANQCWWITVFYIHHWFNIMYCWCLSSCFLGSVVVLRFLWNLYFHQWLSTIHQVFLSHRISCSVTVFAFMQVMHDKILRRKISLNLANVFHIFCLDLKTYRSF